MNNINFRKLTSALFFGTLLFTINRVQAQTVPPWSYEGNTGPDSWGMFSQVCEVGTRQSPINIQISEVDKDEDDGQDDELQFSYKPTLLVVNNDGRDVEVEYEPGSNLMFMGKKFNLIGFHFHTPSEHTINGVNRPVEAHLVHQNDQGELAVVAVFIKPGKKSPILSSILANVPLQGQEQVVNGTEVNASDLLPKKNKRKYFTYPGSLTTPGCSENVTWLVLKSPIQASKAQIDQLTNLYTFSNNRPTQPLNGREIQLFDGK